MRQLLLLILLTYCLQSNAQDNWAAYFEGIDVAEFPGKKFRLKAFVKTNGADEDASIRLWARVDKADGTRGFFENNINNPTRTKVWEQLNLQGTIDHGAAKLYIGFLLQYNGTFSLDDVEVEVETRKNKWTKLFKEDFEGQDFRFKQGTTGGSDHLNSKFAASLDRQNFKNGKQGLTIVGKDVPNFGVNSAVGKYADVNGIKLYYEIYGSGEPLVVLHGNGGSIENAAPHYPKLMEKYKVIAVDTRAQGKSTDSGAPLTYEQMASDINILLDQLKVDSAFIWGQSDGAILSLILAMDYPKKVKRAVAFGSNVQPDSSAVFGWAVKAVDRILATTTDPKERKLVQLMKDHPNIPFSKLSWIKAPVLIMSGDRDIIRLEHTIKIFQSIPNSNLCILPGSTHGGSWERQELFLQLLNDFFNKPFVKPDTRSWFE